MGLNDTLQAPLVVIDYIIKQLVHSDECNIKICVGLKNRLLHRDRSIIDGSTLITLKHGQHLDNPALVE